jgi:hypothetical protein
MKAKMTDSKIAFLDSLTKLKTALPQFSAHAADGCNIKTAPPANTCAPETNGSTPKEAKKSRNEHY